MTDKRTEEPDNEDEDVNLDASAEGEESGLSDFNDSDSDIRSQTVFSDRETDDELESGISYADLLSLDTGPGSDEESEPVTLKKTGGRKKKALTNDAVIKSLIKMSFKDGVPVKTRKNTTVSDLDLDRKVSESEETYALRKKLTNRLLEEDLPDGGHLETWAAIVLASMMTQKVQYGVTYTKDAEETIKYFENVYS